MPSSQGRRAYLDYAATAPFDDRLAEVIAQSSWANANSLHAEGKLAATQLREARAGIARALGAHAPSEIIFTSGGTEANNMAIKGLAHAAPTAGKTHVVISAIEHHSALNAADSLKKEGYKVDRLAPDTQGITDPAALDGLLAHIESKGDATALVCVQMVNNELGTIQPIGDLARVAHEHGARFFSDGVQALGKIEIDLGESGVDACSFSAHKIGAPKGVGVLYLRRSVRLNPLMHGGGQESGLRSGTSNVPGARAFESAIARAVDEREKSWDHALRLKARLLDGLDRLVCAHGVSPTLEKRAQTVPHIVSLLVDGLEGETVVLRADNEGVAISSGSACSSASLDPSHVLTSIGLNHDKALGGIRVSFGSNTTPDDIDRLLDVFPEVLR